MTGYRNEDRASLIFIACLIFLASFIFRDDTAMDQIQFAGLFILLQMFAISFGLVLTLFRITRFMKNQNARAHYFLGFLNFFLAATDTVLLPDAGIFTTVTLLPLLMINLTIGFCMMTDFYKNS